MEGLIHPEFAAALESQRERYNQLFAVARRTARQLDGQEFLGVLRRIVNPLVEAVAEWHPGRVPAVVEVLYPITLQLYRWGLVGPDRRQDRFERLWCSLLFDLCDQLAADPAATVGPLSNALYHVCSAPAGRPEEWARLLTAVAPDCHDAGQLLAVGQVAAWRSGLSQYRQSALETAATLPWQLVARLLEVPASSRGPSELERLAVDPWYDPSQPLEPSGLQLACEVGSFRGLGGEFLVPPRVQAAGESLFATDGVGTWQLWADAFGAVLVRVGQVPEQGEVNSGFRLNDRGMVQGPRHKQSFPILAKASSHAATEHTLAVTLPFSHRIFLICDKQGAG